MITFAEALSGIDQRAMLDMANGTRPPNRYLFNTVLPERNRPSYVVRSGTLEVRPTMAGAVGMDSPYPAGGTISASRFLETTAKIAIDVAIPEETTREIQEWLASLGAAAASKEAVAEEALGFYETVILQSLIDRSEWLRGQALGYGAISWQFNGIDLAVDYGIPTANKLTERTIVGTDAYHLAGSAFWTDVWEARRLLRTSSTIMAMTHQDTLDAILSQSANQIQVISDNGGIFRLAKYVSMAGNTVISSDARDRIDLVVYSEEGEVLAPDSSTPTRVPFMVPGKIVWIGSGTNSGYRVGMGSQDSPVNALEVGYTHVAPTVEGGGRPGRWGQLFTPENAPWQLRGRAAQNLLPVIENPARVVIATTENP